jgi:DNA-directed RNA polymerase subunit L
LKKFKEKKSWRSKKDGVLKSELFKWLGNLFESDHCIFARYILNHPNKKCPNVYPKVTMKTISLNLISCYNAKEWIECLKRKQLLRRELNKMKPVLQLFKANSKF